jgi:hypothetical protein
MRSAAGLPLSIILLRWPVQRHEVISVIKNPRTWVASHEPGEPSPTPGERPHPRSPMLTYPHPPSLTAVHSTNRIMPCGCILRSWPARPKWAPMTVPFLGYTAHDGESTLKEILSMYNSKSDLALPPRLLQFCSPPPQITSKSGDLPLWAI